MTVTRNKQKQGSFRKPSDHEVGGNYEEKVATKIYRNLQFFIKSLGSSKTFVYFLTAKGKTNTYRQRELRW